ncbi:glutaredoxin-C9-like [Chenopodium quinoa]|uniref:Glutaredoxin domain-containing protein n=1 Tax=Chenopodium quinoa TaxID=63459 RepID=A0A803LLN5_CHEQI|nr:glutaredoxin-C9-like [Chenopodium quinoa]
MQEALPYKRWDVLPPVPVASTSSDSGGNVGINNMNNGNTMESLVKENPVIVFGKRGCCMCHVVRKLLLGLGVNPPVFEIDSSNANESLLINSLSKFVVNNNNNSVNTLQFPLVFVGGELFGGLEKVMATHLSGELVPILKQAGALWL